MWSDCRIPGPAIFMCRCASKNEVYSNIRLLLLSTGRNMSIISIVTKNRSLSVEFDTNQSTNIGFRFLRIINFDRLPSNLINFNRQLLDWNNNHRRKEKKYGLLTKREVKMAGYWPSSLFACLWTETEWRSINYAGSSYITGFDLSQQNSAATANRSFLKVI